jgi:hypothetical protein
MHEGGYFGINTVVYTLANGFMFVLLALSGWLLQRSLRRIESKYPRNVSVGGDAVSRAIAYLPQNLIQLHRLQCMHMSWVMVMMWFGLIRS